MSATLAEAVTVEGRFARSANLERDISRPEPLDGYVVTARALDVIERIMNVAATGHAGGAWSLTGPYGSGKSSLALMIDAALGCADTTRQAALKLIDDASPPLGQLTRLAHDRHGTTNVGFYRGLVTANREPLSRTILRALHTAVLRRYGKIPAVSRFSAAPLLRGALRDSAADDPRRMGPSPGALVEIARCLAEDAPLLLIIDEFGKNLEAIRDDTDADPYLLQQLAEAGQGTGLPIFMLTLQHLSFEEHLGGADNAQQREWAKVQGRFDDVAFVESPAQTRALIGTVFNADHSLTDRIARWARQMADAMRSLGINELANPETLTACYPLHPLTVLALPELCSRYGQHERTLFSFLTGPDRNSVPSILARVEVPPSGLLPSVGLDAVYGYFVADGTLNGAVSGLSTRWNEIATRLRDAHDLNESQTRIAKTVAVLNLVSSGGAARASNPVLEFVDPQSAKALRELEDGGLVTYREFADEYRIWHGTDVDIRRLLLAARREAAHRPLTRLLTGVAPADPVVAARHSAEHDVLRVFSQRYASGQEAAEPPEALSPCDGELLLIVSGEGVPRLARSGPSTKPVVAAVPDDVTALEAAAIETAAVAAALEAPEVENDWVARRELSERLSQARAGLEHVRVKTFSAEACRWLLLSSKGDRDLPAGRGSAALSAAADLAYPSTPTIRNEMLNRTDLTSQGAKARRLLLEAMIEHGGEPDLGFSGYGPEMAMYRAFLDQGGLHGRDARNSTMTFRSPTDPSLRPAWQLLQREFKKSKTRRLNLSEVYATLVSPPIGMKAAVVPVFVTAGLLASADEVAVYEHGTFKPRLTPELSERMVRNPSHFEIKHFANTTGARREVIDALAARLDVRLGFRKHRVANVLSVVAHLVTATSRLDAHTLRTSRLAPMIRAVRDALVSAVQPDDLLFAALPSALGFEPIPADTGTYRDAKAYAEATAEALDRLESNYERVLADLLKLLLAESAENSSLAISGQAAALSDEVLDPTVRAFVLALASRSTDDDHEWIETVAAVAAKKAPREWTDDDLQGFQYRLSEHLAAFKRLVALHGERRADGGGPFDALRVTLTRPDGSEYVRLVAVDDRRRSQIDRTLDKTLEELTDLCGSPQHAHQMLLASLAERLLPDLHDDGVDSDFGPLNQKEQHG